MYPGATGAPGPDTHPFFPSDGASTQKGSHSMYVLHGMYGYYDGYGMFAM